MGGFLPVLWSLSKSQAAEFLLAVASGVGGCPPVKGSLAACVFLNVIFSIAGNSWSHSET